MFNMLYCLLISHANWHLTLKKITNFYYTKKNKQNIIIYDKYLQFTERYINHYILKNKFLVTFKTVFVILYLSKT